MRKGVWFEIVLDRLGLAEKVVERLVEEKLKNGLYTETTGTVPVSFSTVVSENGTSAILLCFTENNAVLAEKAIKELHETLRKEIDELAKLKARLQVLKSDRDVFERNGIEVVA